MKSVLIITIIIAMIFVIGINGCMLSKYSNPASANQQTSATLTSTLDAISSDASANETDDSADISQEDVITAP